MVNGLGRWPRLRGPAVYWAGLGRGPAAASSPWGPTAGQAQVCQEAPGPRLNSPDPGGLCAGEALPEEHLEREPLPLSLDAAGAHALRRWPPCSSSFWGVRKLRWTP